MIWQKKGCIMYEISFSENLWVIILYTVSVDKNLKNLTPYKPKT